jgi:dipeptidyl aminopeptidase/acylaminoacyl peptidase
MRLHRILLPVLFAAGSLQAQPPALRALTAADYARAERFMNYNTAPLITGGAVQATWLPGDRFWYRTAVPGGFQFMLVDPARKSRERAFDQVKLAAALSKAADTTVDALHLPFTRFDLSADGAAISFDARGRRWSCDVLGTACALAAEDAAPKNSVTSPDGKRAVFIRDWNLWVRDLPTGKDTPLTTDGVKDFGYATDNAGWTSSDRPIVLWSPDSRKLATFQQDQRNVGEMYLVDTKVGHPVLKAWKYPLPGDSVITMIQRVVIEVDGPRVVRLQMPPDQHRSTACDDVACEGPGEWGDVQWNADGSRLAFASTSRDHKHEWLRIADAATGQVREVMEETVPTFYESGFDHVSWRWLPGTNEVIWYSQRTDWGHLYLYDAATGTLKNPITTGSWKVLQLTRVDEKARTIWFIAAGREPANPYFRQLYRVRFDGKGLTLLSPEAGDHEISMAPSGAAFVDGWSAPDVPPVSALRDAAGKDLLPLEKTDISRLVAAGWKPPIPFTVKARDGKTDLYGLLFRPTGFDSTRKYPIVNRVYPGPQIGSVGSWAFVASRGDAQALAELGFVVVEIDAMGTAMRSLSFQAAYFGDMGDNGLPDQVAGMKQLAERYPWIDLDKAGIYGHSGGGYAAAGAMFRYPDFFKVGISEAGNHDNRHYEDDWAEKWQGLLVKNPDGTTNYDNQANQLVAKNLKGKLLLAHGTMDNNVPPGNTMLVVDALIKANKDFDLLLLPNRTHGFGNEPYMVRRRWDYFAKYLLGAEPPREYQMKGATQPPAIP